MNIIREVLILCNYYYIIKLHSNIALGKLTLIDEG